MRGIENDFPASWSTTFRARSLAVDAVIPKVFLLQAVLSPKKLPGSVLVRIWSGQRWKFIQEWTGCNPIPR